MIFDTDAIVAEVLARARQESDTEVCGFVIEGDRVPVFYEAANKAAQPDREFWIGAEDYARAESLGKIVAVYHSHTGHRDAQPSDADKRTAARSGIPMLIVSTEAGTSCWVHPGGDDFPLTRRLFVYGVFDCYELVRDYYRQTLGIELPPIESEFGWWNKGLNLFVDHVAAAGFTEIPRGTIRGHDLILFQWDAHVPHHIGVYMPDGDLLHHLPFSLSRKGLYGGYWRDRSRHVIRHHTQFKAGDLCYRNGETQRWS